MPPDLPPFWRAIMTEPAPPSLDLVDRPDALLLRLAGRFVVTEIAGAERRLATIPANRPVEADLSAVERLDTAGAWALVRLRARLEAEGQRFEITGAGPEMRALIDKVAASMPEHAPHETRQRGLADGLAALGERVERAGRFGAELLGMLGLVLARLGRTILHPGQFRFTALVHHCEAVGLRAVPIVALMAFLIGVVLAFQGASQLRQFGAEVFVVDLIAISILRELGILLTSIIVAGRTASSYCAAIGSMKMREEIDAMHTLGIDPATALFVPRVLALVLMLPILGLVANLAGLFGGALMSWVELGISPAMFVTRLIEGTDPAHVFVGFVKGPVFALIIGVVGCHAGMSVKPNAESLGRRTSAAVVTAIFAVIVADALFSIFFAEMGM